MSHDFAIWKRSDATKTAMLLEVYDAICEGRDHPAMAKFAVERVEAALQKAFGSAKDKDKLITWNSWSTEQANWIFVHCGHDAASEVAQRLGSLAMRFSYLLVYDPQRIAVWANRRPPLRKTKATRAKPKAAMRAKRKTAKKKAK
jgi:hypothetical protein